MYMNSNIRIFNVLMSFRRQFVRLSLPNDHVFRRDHEARHEWSLPESYRWVERKEKSLSCKENIKKSPLWIAITPILLWIML